MSRCFRELGAFHECLQTLGLLIPFESNMRFQNTWFQNIWIQNIWLQNVWPQNIWPQNIWLQKIWIQTTWFQKWQARYMTPLGGQYEVIDSAAGSQLADSRRILNYRYWRSRLLALDKVFEDSAPRTLYQWWSDKRRRRDRIGFFIGCWGAVLAVLSLVLGTILAGLSLQESQAANVLASIASSSAAQSAAYSSASSSSCNITDTCGPSTVAVFCDGVIPCEGVNNTTLSTAPTFGSSALGANTSLSNKVSVITTRVIVTKFITTTEFVSCTSTSKSL